MVFKSTHIHSKTTTLIYSNGDNNYEYDLESLDLNLVNAFILSSLNFSGTYSSKICCPKALLSSLGI